MKRVITSRQKINPFGGINFVIHALKEQGIGSIIDKTLGLRPKQATYSYSDIILFWIYCNLCGAERLEDSKHLKNYLKGTPSLKMPSPDAIGRVLKKLATKNILMDGPTIRKDHWFNNNDTLHDLLMGTIKKLGVLDLEKAHTLDYDNTIIQTEKYDVKLSYEGTYGYQPGASFIGKVPVYVQGRNGDAVALTCMHDTLERTLALLDKHEIKISRFRSDSAAYQKRVIQMMDDRGIEFFIRGRSNQQISNQIANITEWKEFRYNGLTRHITSIVYRAFGKHGKDYRCVVTRHYSKENGYSYNLIMSNNWSMSDEELFIFYNQRGKIERNFDTLKNDFNWARLPFSFLNENTVFLLLSALTYVVYLYCVKRFSRKVDFLKGNHRLKNFIYFFITVGAEWISDSDLKLYTTNRYEVLLE